MVWVGWREQRLETIIAAAVLALIAAFLIPTGLTIAGAYHDSGLAHCSGVVAPGPCDDAINAFETRFSRLGDFISWFTLLPGLVGILLAAPFITQLENGSYKLDWTQSITRGRWVAGKLGLAVLSVLIAGGVLIALLTWWRTPFVHLQGRMGNSIYDAEGTVVLAYTLFALALAAAIGAVWRRAVPAMVVGFLGYFALRLFVDTWLRQRLVSPVSSTWPVQSKGPDLNRAWVLQQYPVDKSGHAVSAVLCPHNMGGACMMPKSAMSGVGYMHAVYQPGSHFWALQAVETAIFAGVAAGLLAFAALWTMRRTA